jgi:hypothetical protein
VVAQAHVVQLHFHGYIKAVLVHLRVHLLPRRIARWFASLEGCLAYPLFYQVLFKRHIVKVLPTCCRSAKLQASVVYVTLSCKNASILHKYKKFL